MKEHFVQQAVRQLCSDSPNLGFWAVFSATLACRAFGIDHWKGALGQFTVDTGSAHRLQQLSCLLMPSWPSHRRRTFEVRPSGYLLKIPPTQYRSWCLPFVAIIGYGQGIPECNHFAYSSELVCVCRVCITDVLWATKGLPSVGLYLESQCYNFKVPSVIGR